MLVGVSVPVCVTVPVLDCVLAGVCVGVPELLAVLLGVLVGVSVPV